MVKKYPMHKRDGAKNIFLLTCDGMINVSKIFFCLLSSLALNSKNFVSKVNGLFGFGKSNPNIATARDNVSILQ